MKLAVQCCRFFLCFAHCITLSQVEIIKNKYFEYLSWYIPMYNVSQSDPTLPQWVMIWANLVLHYFRMLPNMFHIIQKYVLWDVFKRFSTRYSFIKSDPKYFSPILTPKIRDWRNLNLHYLGMLPHGFNFSNKMVFRRRFLTI